MGLFSRRPLLLLQEQSGYGLADVISYEVVPCLVFFLLFSLSHTLLLHYSTCNILR